MKIYFEKYEKRLNSLVNDSIDCIADSILTDMGIREEDDPNYNKYYEVYSEIQKHLIEKWTEELKRKNG